MNKVIWCGALQKTDMLPTGMVVTVSFYYW